METSGSVWYLMWVRDEGSLAHFGQAIDIARKQKAKSWELRAAISQARLYRDRGEAEKARTLLTDSYGGFNEGFGTLDLREAKSLLGELS